MRTNEDGEEVFRLLPMTPMAAGMTRDRTPHPPVEGEYEQQFMAARPWQTAAKSAE